MGTDVRRGGNDTSVIGMLGGMALMLSAFIGANYYIARRLCQCVKPCFAHMNVGLFSAVICAVMVLGMLSGFVRGALSVPEPVRHCLGQLGAYWMGIFVYLFLFFIAADIIFWLGGLIKVMPAPVPQGYRQVSGLLVIALTACTVSYGVYHAGQLRHISYDIWLDKADPAEEIEMVLISDLHLGAVGSETRLAGIVRAINEIQPDLVCIAGDIFDNNYRSIEDPDEASRLLLEIKARYGVYACLGNHDAGETVGEMEAFLERSHIKTLYDEYEVIDGRLVVVGRLDPSPIGGFGGRERKPFGELMGDAALDPALPVVVMDHNPAHVDEYGTEADLILCGHTHKGQIFPGSLITKRLFPVDYGYYRKDAGSPHVIVTSGAGTWGMPMRVGTDCEIVRIRLHGVSRSDNAPYLAVPKTALQDTIGKDGMRQVR